MEGVHQVDWISSLITASCRVDNANSIVPRYVHIEDFCIHAWSGIVKNLRVDILLGISIFDQFILRTFAARQKAFSRYSGPVLILTSNKVISSVYGDTALLNVNSNLLTDDVSDFTLHGRSGELSILRQHYLYVLKVLGSCRLRTAATSCDTDVPWPHGSNEYFTWKSILCLHFKFEGYAIEYSEIYDIFLFVKCSYMHPPGAQQWKIQVKVKTTEQDSEQQTGRR